MAEIVLEYQNPVWDGYFADPFALKHNGEYWAYGTGKTAADGRRFPVLHSKDLVHWEYLGGALEPLRRPSRRHYWAPEVAFHNGTFYMYYSAAGDGGDQGHRLRVATADHPAGLFIDSGKEILPDEGFTIDAHPFRDPKDGQWYLFFSKDFFDDRVGTGTAVAPLADDMISISEAPRPVLRASSDWHIHARDRHIYDRHWDAWHTVEGAHVVAHNDGYYCLYSGGSWKTPDYGVGFGVASHPLGPWRDEWNQEGPAVLRGISGKVLGPGHNSVVLGPDERMPFIVYHAWDLDHTARRLCIDPLVWETHEDGDHPRCAGPTFEPQRLVLSNQAAHSP